MVRPIVARVANAVFCPDGAMAERTGTLRPFNVFDVVGLIPTLFFIVVPISVGGFTW